MSKVVITLVSLVVLAWLGTEVYSLQKERAALSRDYKEVKEDYDEIGADNERLSEKIEYLSEPRNLEKELRSQFNYKYPHEQLIIVVPEETEQ